MTWFGPPPQWIFHFFYGFPLDTVWPTVSSQSSMKVFKLPQIENWGICGPKVNSKFYALSKTVFTRSPSPQCSSCPYCDDGCHYCWCWCGLLRSSRNVIVPSPGPGGCVVELSPNLREISQCQENLKLIKIIYNLLGIFANQTVCHLWFLWTSIPISHLQYLYS